MSEPQRIRETDIERASRAAIDCCDARAEGRIVDGPFYMGTGEAPEYWLVWWDGATHSTYAFRDAFEFVNVPRSIYH